MVSKKKVTPQALQKTGDPLEVSHSTIKTWRRCHAKYDYHYIQLLERRRPILQLIRGTMVGECLDAIALRRSSPKAPAWIKTLDPFKKEYGKLFKDEQEYYGPIIEEVTRIVTKYEAIYAADGLTYQKGSDGLPYELPVRVELAPGIVFTGSIDKMPTDKQGRVWDMDHKTHKKIPEAEDRFRDLQQVFYQWAMPLSGYDKPTGVIWDYIRTKPPTVPEELKKGGLTKRKDIDTDHDTYMAQITRLGLNPKDYQEILKPLKARGNLDFYQRVPLPNPSPILIKNVVEEAKTTAIEIKRSGGVDKTRTIDLDCKRCQFYSVCQAEFRGLDSTFIRKAEYQIQKDPRHVHLMTEDD